MTSPSPSVVPPCPQGLTIRREDFLADSFTADSFLSDWHASAAAAAASSGRPRTLETLRDDLGVYLKVLQSAMIELINEDYADFVNLSTNLVGLDQSIDKLEEPLIEYRKRVADVKGELGETLDVLQEKLRQREALYGKKMALQNLEHISNTLAKIERLLGLSIGSSSEIPPSVEMSGDLVERVATEINHLNFCVSKCRASTFVKEIQPRLKIIGDHLHGSLESQLLDALSTSEGGGAEVLRRCLRVFATVDRISDAESLVRTKILRPALEEVICEEALAEDPMGLQGVLQKVLKLVPTHLGPLLMLTNSHYDRTSSSAKVISEFDFLCRAFFPEVLEQIDENISNIFSAGNPNIFFNSYQTCLEFLLDFERELGTVDAVAAFRETEACKQYLSRWNLPVYFQIRFQELALPVENSIQNIFQKVEDEGGCKFRLRATDTAMTAIEKCWSESVFIDALAHKFWKLTLQIISRFSTGVRSAPDLTVGLGDVPVTQETEALRSSATTVDLKAMNKGHARSSSYTGLVPEEKSKETYRSRPQDLIRLWLDVNLLTKELSGRIFFEVIAPRFEELAPQQRDALRGSLDEGCDQLESNLSLLSDIIVDHLSDKCLPYLKQVSDIPRLYRRTNRDLPSKPCNYVISMLAPITSFKRDHQTAASEVDTILHTCLQGVFRRLSAQYLSNVSDVLAAVQKMEESLRRLKRVRDGKSAGGTKEVGGDQGKTSDDDKIRLQLFLDVRHFLDKMSGDDFGVSMDDVKTARDLDSVVSEATRSLRGPLQ